MAYISPNVCTLLAAASFDYSRELCSHHRRQPDPTKQFCRVGVGGVKWVVVTSLGFQRPVGRLSYHNKPRVTGELCVTPQKARLWLVWFIRTKVCLWTAVRRTRVGRTRRSTRRLDGRGLAGGAAIFRSLPPPPPPPCVMAPPAAPAVGERVLTQPATPLLAAGH